MRTKRNMIARELLAWGVAFLIMGLVPGAFAGIAAVKFTVKFVDDLTSVEQSGLLFLFTLSSVAASFLLSVSVSFCVAYAINRKRESVPREIGGHDTKGNKGTF